MKNLSPNNENIMSSQRRYALLSLRKKYAYTLPEPTLNFFNLDDSLVKEILSFNKDVDSKNNQATNEANLINNKNSGKERGLFYIILNITFWPLAGLVLYLILNNTGADFGEAAGFTLFIAGIPAMILAGTIPEKIWSHKSVAKLPLHVKSENLDKYNKYVADYKLFNELVVEERRDQEERAKAEYWFSLGGFEFEDEMTRLFSLQGYRATKTQNTGDGGIDIILIDKNTSKTIVQCKAHKKPIGPNDIRALFGVMKADGADKAILINLGGFTQGVKDFAQINNIVLMDINDVLELQEKFENSWKMDGVEALNSPREKSEFEQEVLNLHLEKGGYAYISHKEWLSKVGEQNKASEKNGPIYTLRKYGIDCRAINLSGRDLELVAKNEGRELTETDVIYSMTALK